MANLIDNALILLIENAHTVLLVVLQFFKDCYRCRLSWQTYLSLSLSLSLSHTHTHTHTHTHIFEIEEIFHKMKNDYEININGSKLFNLRFADNIALTTGRRDEVRLNTGTDRPQQTNWSSNNRYKNKNNDQQRRIHNPNWR